MKKLVVLFLFFSSQLFAHCLVPEESIWHFECTSMKEDKVEVVVDIYSDMDPRNCPAIIDFKLTAQLPMLSHDNSYIGGKPIFRRLPKGSLEILVGFNSQSHFSIELMESGSARGYIEFAGGPSFHLFCGVMDLSMLD